MLFILNVLLLLTAALFIYFNQAFIGLTKDFFISRLKCNFECSILNIMLLILTCQVKSVMSKNQNQVKPGQN